MKKFIIGALAPVFLLVATMDVTGFVITVLFLSGTVMVRFIRLRARKSPAKTSPEQMSYRGECGMNAVNVPESPREIFNGVKYGMSNGISIVVASDYGDFTRDLCEYLSASYSIRYFSNGLQAWNYILDESVDLLVCDTNLTGIGGVELSSRVKTSQKVLPCPVILLDSFADDCSSHRRRHSLADIYMPKPMKPKEVKTEMDILLSNNFSFRKYILSTIFGDAFLEKRLNDDKDIACQFIADVNNLILEHIADKGLNVETLASNMNMSRSKFYVRWKSLTGTAPQEFLYAVRMEKARELLETGNYPVNMLPEMVGWKDEKYFRKNYKEHFGKTPSESVKYGRYLAREQETKQQIQR